MKWPGTPNSYISDSIYLDNWGIFGGQEWDEWRFGFEIIDANTNEVQENWDAVAGIAFMNNEG